MTDRQPTEQPVEYDDLELQTEQAEQVTGGRKAAENPLEYVRPLPPPPTTK